MNLLCLFLSSYGSHPLSHTFLVGTFNIVFLFYPQRKKRKRNSIWIPSRGAVSTGLNSVGSTKMVQMFSSETLDAWVCFTFKQPFKEISWLKIHVRGGKCWFSVQVGPYVSPTHKITIIFELKGWFKWIRMAELSQKMGS